MRQLKPLQTSNIDTLLLIEKSAYPVPWTYGMFFDCLIARHDCHGLFENKQLIAYFIAQKVVDEFHLLNICVDPLHQQKGMGRYLLDTYVTMATAYGMRRALLEVRVSNQVARHLYVSSGFVEIGQRKNYYPCVQGREDGIVMARSL